VHTTNVLCPWAQPYCMSEVDDVSTEPRPSNPHRANLFDREQKRPPNNLQILYWQFTKKNQSNLIILATNHMTHQNHWKPLDATKPSVSRIRPSDAQTSELEPQTAELTESSWTPVGWQPTISHPPWITVSTSKLRNITLPPNAKH
jgi:hypothetical protein